MFGDPRLPPRFWDKVFPEPNTGCWLWTGHVTPAGDPLYRTPKRHVTAHHVVFRAFIGIQGVEFGREVLRSCGENLCCNSDHLCSRPKDVRPCAPPKPKASRLEYARNPDFLSSDSADEGKQQRIREAGTRWQALTRKRIAIERHRERLLKYGITDEQYKTMLNDQMYRCAVCGVSFDDAKPVTRANIDHCHSTGLVRGLLCTRCNTGIGMLLDSPAILAVAIEYLRKAA